MFYDLARFSAILEGYAGLSFYQYVMGGYGGKAAQSTVYIRDVDIREVNAAARQSAQKEIENVSGRFPVKEIKELIDNSLGKLNPTIDQYRQLAPNGIEDFGVFFRREEIRAKLERKRVRWEELTEAEQADVNHTELNLKWSEEFFSARDKSGAVSILFLDLIPSSYGPERLPKEIYDLLYQYSILCYEGFALRKRAGLELSVRGFSQDREWFARSEKNMRLSEEERARLAKSRELEESLSNLKQPKWWPLGKNNLFDEMARKIDALSNGAESSAELAGALPIREGRSKSPIVIAPKKLYNSAKKQINDDAFDALYRQSVFDNLFENINDGKGNPIRWRWYRLAGKVKGDEVERVGLLGKSSIHSEKWLAAGALLVDWLWDSTKIPDNRLSDQELDEVRFEAVKSCLSKIADDLWSCDPSHDYGLLSLFPVANLNYLEIDEAMRNIKRDHLNYLAAATLASVLYGPSALPEMGLSFNMFRGSTTTEHLSDLLREQSDSFLARGNEAALLVTLTKPNAKDAFAENALYCGLYRLADKTCYHIGSNPPTSAPDEPLREEALIVLGDISHSRHWGDLKIQDGALLFRSLAEEGGWHYKSKSKDVGIQVEQYDPVEMNVGDILRLTGDSWNINLVVVQMLPRESS